MRVQVGRSTLALVVLASVTAAFNPTPTSAGPPSCEPANQTREGEVMVVSDNIFEAKVPDANNTDDVDRFVERMLTLTSEYDPNNLGEPDLPDVVLLQEVRKVAVTNVRDKLNQETGCGWVIATNASRTAFKWANKETRTKGIIKDTAVLFNSTTMQLVSKGYIDLSYKLSSANPGDYVYAKQAAWARLVEKDLGSPTLPGNLLNVAAASLHYPRNKHFKNATTAESLKRKFSKKVADKLNTVLPDPDRNLLPHSDNKIHVMAGDLNSFRFKPGVTPKEEQLHYALTTAAPYNFKDGPIELSLTAANPIDFLFSTGNFVTAAADKENPTHDPNHPLFYSNHDLRWGVLEGLDLTGPTQPGDEFRRQKPFGAGLRWFLHSRDAGTGLLEFQIQRKETSETDDQYELVGTVPADGVTDEWIDDGSTVPLTPGTAYVYRLMACDAVGNCSAPLITESITFNN